MNQKEIDSAVVVMQIFLLGLTFTFDANFHELKEITDGLWVRLSHRIKKTVQEAPANPSSKIIKTYVKSYKETCVGYCRHHP